jgi:Tol biopolymer transport system component
MAPDGSFLIFTSNRPASSEGEAQAVVRNGKSTPGVGGNLWRVDRKGSEWSAPVRLPDTVNSGTRIYSPSVVGDGSVYFQKADEASGEFHLWRSQYRAGEYLAPVRVTLGEGGTHELDPAVAPDESFIVFDSNLAAKDSPDRLFLAFREGEHWGQPIDLSDLVGSKNNPWGAHLGPDGRSLYFTSDRLGKVTWPRTPEQMRDDLVRWQSWDNGSNNIWYVSLASVLDARHTR